MHVKKALGVLLIVLGLFFLLVTGASLVNPYSDPVTMAVAFIIFILSIIFIVVGIILFRSGNAEIREAKAQFARENQVEANLDKDRRIKELEKRLEKIEDSTKSKDNPENS